MESLTGTEIRDFTVRGNYFNQRSLLSRTNLRSSKKDNIVSNSPGFSPPIVEFDLHNGTAGSIVVSEADIPLLCGDDFERGKRHLSLIVNARRGDPKAVKDLSFAAQADFLGGMGRVQPSESEFVVPCTSSQAHSQQDISQKGSILLKLSQLGYPVPDFVVLTAEAYIKRAQHFEEYLLDAIKQLEILTMQGLGSCRNPLVFAIRCATTNYIPGVMDTYLNVGVTESALPCLETMYGSVAARKMFLNNLRNLCRILHPDQHEAIVSAAKSDLSPDEVMSLTQRLFDIIRTTDKRLVEDPFAQAAFFAKQAYKDFEENQALVLSLCKGTEHYPSLILQKMICTVRHENSYAGVIHSRDTKTGLGIELQTAHNIFGEEIMTGTAEIQSTSFEDREAIKGSFPAVYHFIPHLSDLEREFESPVTIEFAVEATSRYQWFALLQLNETGMAGRAALTSAMDLHKSGTISRERATQLIRPYHIKQLTSDTIDEEDFKTLTNFCSGVSVLPRSAVSARVYFTGEAALSAKRDGEKVCLCKRTFVPTDAVVMREVDGILSLTSAAIHVVTICQSMGIPALLNLEKNGVSWEPGGSLVNSSGREIKEGDWITLSSRRRTIYQGKAKFKPARLLRYMKGESVELDAEDRKSFASIAYAYRYYQQLIRGLMVEQVSTLNEVVRLVNFEMRGESEEAKRLVNSWFDDREQLYIEEVLKSDIGDHLGQARVFELLTLHRKIRFFKGALAKCTREHISGYEAGAFMLGRFLSSRYPVAFWKSFNPSEIGLLVNEWVLFEKYMQLLHNVGERKVILARKQILKGGLDQISLQPGNLQCFITLKLSGTRLEEARDSLPEGSDRQAARVFELLQQPYSAFYDFSAVWSVNQLEKICREENLSLPKPDDI